MSTTRPPANQPAAKAAAPTRVRRLRRAERREQLLAAATQAFARGGFAATSLDDIAGWRQRFPAETPHPAGQRHRPRG